MLSKTTDRPLPHHRPGALAAPATAPAAVRLVDDDAQANFGSCETTACASIPYAVGQAQPGDTIRIAAGSYTVAGLTTAKTLHFEGAGADATKVVSTVGTPLTLTAGGSVKDLRLQGGASYGIGRSGLRVTGVGTPGSDAADLTRLVVRSGSGNDDHGDDTEPALDVDGSTPAAGSLWVEGDELTLHGADESSSNGPGVIARGRHAGVVLNARS
jgi:hypothetical protein